MDAKGLVVRREHLASPVKENITQSVVCGTVASGSGIFLKPRFVQLSLKSQFMRESIIHNKSK